MYFAHHFADRRTLSRARYWLEQLGVEPRRLEVRADGPHPHIGFNLGLAEASKAHAIIRAVEAAEPEEVGPDIWDLAPPADHPETSCPAAPRMTPIGWHPLEARRRRADSWAEGLAEALAG